jgi:thiazole/oxazole-forming peptide maturase SagD family component
MQRLKLIKLLINTLNNQGLLESINKVELFYDEPKIPLYSTSFKNFIDGVGVSIKSKQEALFKSLIEAIERFATYNIENKLLVYVKTECLKTRVINHPILNKVNLSSGTKIACVGGYNLKNNQSVLIPAQLIYLSRKQIDKVILPKLFSGSAAGFDKTTTLLRAIYEVVERDAFMTIYLNKISPRRVNLSSIRNSLTNKIVKNYRRYNLEPYLFEITNDLGIPTFLSILVDLTTKGQCFTPGGKSSLDVKEAMIGALTETHLCRSGFRYKTINNFYKKNRQVVSNKMKTMSERAAYWFPIKMLAQINFLFQSSEIFYKISPFIIKPSYELALLKEKIEKKGFQIYYVNITPPFFKKLGGYVYKVIIPGLQDVYFDEENKNKYINVTRLKQVAKYFGKKKVIINRIPHFFL